MLSAPSFFGAGIIGTTVSVNGRDVTLGPHSALPITHTGEVEAIHVNATRVRLVLIMRTVRGVRTTRVIEVME